MKKTDLAKNTILLSIGTIITKGINLLMIPLFSSWLSTEDYGTFDLLCTYVSLLIPFITMSSSDAIFRFLVDKDDEKEKKSIIGDYLVGLNEAWNLSKSDQEKEYHRFLHQRCKFHCGLYYHCGYWSV